MKQCYRQQYCRLYYCPKNPEQHDSVRSHCIISHNTTSFSNDLLQYSLAQCDQQVLQPVGVVHFQKTGTGQSAPVSCNIFSSLSLQHCFTQWLTFQYHINNIIDGITIQRSAFSIFSTTFMLPLMGLVEASLLGLLPHMK